MPFHAQEDHHCGPASLLTVLEASGVEASYQALVDGVYVPGLEGSLRVEMKAAARANGRIPYVLPADPEAVVAEIAAGRPVLVLLNLGVPSRPVWHYAVVVGFDPKSNQLILRSGRQKRMLQKARAWLRQWNWAGRWAVVLLKPGEWPAKVDRERLLAALAAWEDQADIESALLAWRVAAEHWPDEPLAWLGVGNAEYAARRFTQAEGAYRRGLVFAPDHLPLRFNLAAALEDQGRPCDAQAALGSPPEPEHPLAPRFEGVAARLAHDCPV